MSEQTSNNEKRDFNLERDRARLERIENKLDALVNPETGIYARVNGIWVELASREERISHLEGQLKIITVESFSNMRSQLEQQSRMIWAIGGPFFTGIGGGLIYLAYTMLSSGG